MGIILSLSCALMFSLNYIFIQLGMRKSSKEDNGVFASLLANILMLLVVYFFVVLLRTEHSEFNVYGILFFILAGFLASFVGRVTLFEGIRKIGSSRSAAIKNTAPVFTVFLAVTLLGERITFLAGIGIIVIFFFLFMQARHDFIHARQVDEGQENKTGIILSVIAAMMFGMGQLARKQGIILYADPVLGALVAASFGFIVFVLAEAFKKRLHDTVLGNIKSMNVFFILAGIAQGFAQISFFTAITTANVSYVSVIAATEPILTVFLSRIILAKEENIGLRISITACAVFLGTFIIVIGK